MAGRSGVPVRTVHVGPTFASAWTPHLHGWETAGEPETHPGAEVDRDGRPDRPRHGSKTPAFSTRRARSDVSSRVGVGGRSLRWRRSRRGQRSQPHDLPDGDASRLFRARTLRSGTLSRRGRWRWSGRRSCDRSKGRPRTEMAFRGEWPRGRPVHCCRGVEVARPRQARTDRRSTPRVPLHPGRSAARGSTVRSPTEPHVQARPRLLRRPRHSPGYSGLQSVPPHSLRIVGCASQAVSAVLRR